MRAFLRLLLRREHAASFMRVLRAEGPVATLRRGGAWVRRLWASTASFDSAQGRSHPLPLMPFWVDMAEASAFTVSPSAPALSARKRVIAMIGDLNLQQCKKYRIEQLDEIWAKAGVEYRFAHYQDVPRCIDILQNATHLMLYRLQRHDLVSTYLYEARRLRLPVIYDIDDPLFSIPAYATYDSMGVLPPEMKRHFMALAPLYLDVMNAADALTFSTPGLLKHATEFSSRPSCLRRNFADRLTLDAGHGAMASAADKRAAGETFTVAFASGSLGHEVDFAVAGAQVRRFLSGAPDRRLMILGHFDAALLPVELADRIETHPFTDYKGYLHHLARADVAVMPLSDNPFNRCKSGVRVIDASAAGVPSLVSRIGDTPSHVAEGETGHILGAHDDWEAALATLARDRPLARRMGQAARERLERDWSARLTAPVVDAALLDWVRE